MPLSPSSDTEIPSSDKMGALWLCRRISDAWDAANEAEQECKGQTLKGALIRAKTALQEAQREAEWALGHETRISRG